MNKNNRYGICLVFSIIAILLGSTVVASIQKIETNADKLFLLDRGQTLYVGGSGPNNYTSIQSAIDDAVDGYTIFVFNGTYNEHLIITKSINLIGENKDNTIINSGGTYVLNIREDNVNVSGFTIRTLGYTLYSTVFMWGSDYNNFFGNVIENGEIGIEMHHPQYTTVSENIIVNCRNGIRLRLSTHNILQKNIILNNTHYGIRLESSSNFNSFIGNSISFNQNGLNILGSTGNIIYHNNFINNTENAYDDNTNTWDNGYSSGGGNYWSDYTGKDFFSGPGQNATGADGFGDTSYNVAGGNNQDNYPLMDPWPSDSLIDIFVDGNGLLEWYDKTHVRTIQEGINNATSGNTIFVYHGMYTENIIINKTITLRGEDKDTTIIDGKNGYTVISISAEYVTISEFTIQNTVNVSIGIWLLSNSNDSTITENKIILDQNAGLWSYSSNNTIKKNIFIGNGHGIVFKDSSNNNDNIISNNNISSNSGLGIYLSEANRNIVFNNTIRLNDLGVGIWSSYNNVIYHNNFIDNNQDAFDSAINVWNLDYPICGNYWSNYTGNDLFSGPGQNITGSDDIGDSPYNISGGANQDNYPLMMPWGIIPPADIYVDDNADPTWYNETHVRTIQEGINRASIHDIIYVHTGTYNENVIVNKTINLIGEDKNNTIIDGSRDTVMRIISPMVIVSGFTIQNGGDTMDDSGIFIASDSNIIIDNIVNNTETNIEIVNSSYNIVSGNIVGFNTDGKGASNMCGIVLDHSFFNVVEDNRFEYIATPICIINSNNNEIQNNIILDLCEGLYIESSSNLTIVNNLFNHSGIIIRGESIDHFTTHTIENNYVNFKPIRYYKNQNNLVVPNDAGQVILANCTNITIEDLDFSGTVVGVQLHFCSFSTIRENTFGDNLWAGCFVSNSHHNFIYNNVINNVIWYSGIMLMNSSNNSIYRNICAVNGSGYGFNIYNSEDNKLFENLVVNNYVGMYFRSSNNNIIYHNNFINNTINANIFSGLGNNLWDDGYPSGGNYWDDYNGSDLFSGPNQNMNYSDGIGDTPYNISGGVNQDRYPFMQPYGWNEPEIDWWSMFHHDQYHSGYSTSTAPETNTVIWNYSAIISIYSSPATVNNKVYFGSSNNRVYCLNASTGEQIWTYGTYDCVDSSPVVYKGKVYIGSDDGHLYCLNASTGDWIWQYTTNHVVWSSPTVADEKVYFGSNRALYCINASTGAKIWNYTIGFTIYSSPAVANGKVYIGSDDNNVYCFNATTGEKIWNYTTGGDVTSSPAIANGKVYIGSYDHNVYCLNATTGAKIWNYNTFDWIHSSPAVVDGKVYIGSASYKVYCLNASTGEQIWNYTTGASISSSPAVADGKVYIGSYDHNVYCLNATTGEKIWNYTTGFTVYSSPAVANGKVYVGSRDSKLYCFGPYENFPPRVPNNPNPANESTDVRTNSILTWNGGDPNHGDSCTYDVFLGVTPSVQKVSSNQTQTTYTPGILNFNTTYYWRIIAWDMYNASTIGPLWHFTTKQDSPPTQPSNPHPINNSINISFNTDLSWSPSTDPDYGDTITYDVCFGTTNPPQKNVSNQTSTMYDPGLLLSGTTYYWRIIAWDNHNVSTRSPLWCFTTDHPPYQPSNPHPDNHTINVDVEANLNWIGGDPDMGDRVTYDVYFGTINPPLKMVSNQTTTTYNPETMNYNTTYYWQITAWDKSPDNLSTSGPIWWFKTIDITPPEWRNQGQNHTLVPPGTYNSLYSQGRDNAGLDYAYLSTNESGYWFNYSGGEWWNTNWRYQKPILINHTLIPGSLTDFPVFISTTSPNFINHAQENGNDFVFIDQTNTVQLNHEIESYNSTTGELVVWVKVPFLSPTTDTVLYLYYGNPNCANQENSEGAWSNGYAMVHHLDGVGIPNLKDSTSNHWDITSAGGNPLFNQPGKIGTCVDFDGVNDYLKADAFQLLTDGSHTASAWVYVDGNAGQRKYLFESHSDVSVSLLVWTNETFKARTRTASSVPVCYSHTAVNPSNPQWYYVCSRVNADTNLLDIFVNGVYEAGTFFTGTVNPATGFDIGMSNLNSYWMNGKIDEIHVSNSARNNTWIRTEYNMITQPTVFTSVGDETKSVYAYGSPMDLYTGPGEWVWTNFTWQNPEIPNGTTVGWRIFYVDLSGNKNCTPVLSFQIGIPTPIIINGYCSYRNGYEVNPVNVEIINLNAGLHWMADTNGNYYSLELLRDTQITVGDVLRIIARDQNESVNVTDYITTVSDFEEGIITINPVLDIHYRDLKHFPYYLSQVNSGAMVMKQMMDYLMWNSTIYPQPQDLYSEQTIYNNYSGGDWINTSELCSGLNTEINDYQNGWIYGYFFSPSAQDQALDALKSAVIWLDYNISGSNEHRLVDVPKLGHPYHVPIAVPTGGNYNHWMTIRGIHTNRSMWDSSVPGDHHLINGPITIYGFWMNDPSTGGLGENTYVTAEYFTTAYFQPLNTPGDYYNNKYVVITDPPQNSPPVDTTLLTLNTANPQGFTKDEIKQVQTTQKNKQTTQLNTIYISKAQQLVHDVLRYDPTELDQTFTESTVLKTPTYKGNTVIIIFNHPNGTVFTVSLNKTTGELKQFSINEKNQIKK
ncbi:MAG: DUF2341 domain-containing protein [Methanobacteriota archaeon]